MANVLDVAKKAGVSKSTVSRYFNNGYVSSEARKKIEAAIKDTNFAKNSIGYMLKHNSTKTIALCVPLISHPFFSKITQVIENETYKNGYKLLITCSNNSREREETFINLVLHKQVDGIIFITHNKYEEFNYSLPAVTIDRRFNDNIPCITSNNYEATYQALEYLYQKGHRKIGFIGGRPNVQSEVKKRYLAYLDFINKYNLENLSYYEDFRHGEEYEKSVIYLDKFKDLDAVFATSDAFGFALYRYANTVNRKFDIITYDGCMSNVIQHPNFTTVQQNIEEMGKEVVDVLIKKIKNEKTNDSYIVNATFVKGETA